MNDEPVRLKSAPEGAAARLLHEAGGVPAMSAEDRAALRVAIAALPGAGGGPSGGAEGAAPADAPAAGTGVKAAGAALGAKGVAIAVAVALAAAGGLLAWRGSSDGDASAAATAAPAPSPPSGAAETAPLARRDDGVSPATAPTDDPAPPDEVASSSGVVAPAPRRTAAAAPSHAPIADALARETALVARARSALPSQPAEALRALDEHARAFPRGELAPERDHLRVRALEALGRSAEAAALARAYPTRHPGSPYAPQVARALARLEGGAP